MVYSDIVSPRSLAALWRLCTVILSNLLSSSDLYPSLNSYLVSVSYWVSTILRIWLSSPSESLIGGSSPCLSCLLHWLSSSATRRRDRSLTLSWLLWVIRVRWSLSRWYGTVAVVVEKFEGFDEALLDLLVGFGDYVLKFYHTTVNIIIRACLFVLLWWLYSSVI